MDEQLTALVEQAGKEVGDAIVLVFDDQPNSSQVGQFVTEGFEAFKKLADAIAAVPAEKRAAALSHLLNAIHARANAGIPALQL